MTSYTNQKTRKCKTHLNDCERAERASRNFWLFHVLNMLVNHIFVGAIAPPLFGLGGPPPPPLPAPMGFRGYNIVAGPSRTDKRKVDIAKILDACFYVCAYGYFSRASNNKKYWTMTMTMTMTIY